MKKLLSFILILFIAACGKKGPIVPPESLSPAPVQTLKVEQKGEQVLVSWKAPERDVDGRPLKELAGFRVFRREMLPPNQDCEECPDAYRLLKVADLEYLRDVRVIDKVYVFTDSETVPGTTYQYKVISFRKDGSESGPSNKVRRQKAVPPLALVLQATSTPTSVLLQWPAPQLPEGLKLVGYNVYRRKAAETGLPYLITPTPLKENRYEDLQLARGTVYVYTVRCVAAAGEYELEGESSNEATGALTSPE